MQQFYENIFINNFYFTVKITDILFLLKVEDASMYLTGAVTKNIFTFPIESLKKLRSKMLSSTLT